MTFVYVAAVIVSYSVRVAMSRPGIPTLSCRDYRGDACAPTEGLGIADIAELIALQMPSTRAAMRLTLANKRVYSHGLHRRRRLPASLDFDSGESYGGLPRMLAACDGPVDVSVAGVLLPVLGSLQSRLCGERQISGLSIHPLAMGAVQHKQAWSVICRLAKFMGPVTSWRFHEVDFNNLRPAMLKDATHVELHSCRQVGNFLSRFRYGAHSGALTNLTRLTISYEAKQEKVRVPVDFVQFAHLTHLTLVGYDTFGYPCVTQESVARPSPFPQSLQYLELSSPHVPMLFSSAVRLPNLQRLVVRSECECNQTLLQKYSWEGVAHRNLRLTLHVDRGSQSLPALLSTFQPHSLELIGTDPMGALATLRGSDNTNYSLKTISTESPTTLPWPVANAKVWWALAGVTEIWQWTSASAFPDEPAHSQIWKTVHRVAGRRDIAVYRMDQPWWCVEQVE